MRSAIGIIFSIAILQFEGGFRMLRTDKPGLHILRGFFIVVANMSFFAALAVMPLADATALFFVAPLLITILSIPYLGEKWARGIFWLLLSVLQASSSCCDLTVGTARFPLVS